MKKYILDGSKIKNVDEFIFEFTKMINSDQNYFGKNLDSFDDCLFGGYGLENPCTIIWKNSAVSQVNLGYDAMAYWCQDQIDRKNFFDEEGLEFLKKKRDDATDNLGETLFDVIVSKINSVSSRSNGRLTIQLILD